MAVEHVAFFRNLNLGHARCPDRAGLEAAFHLGGAEQVKNFQTNGTVLFDAADPGVTVQRVLRELTATGYVDTAFVRTVAEVRDILAQIGPPTTVADVYRELVTFFQAPLLSAPPTPWSSPSGDLLVTAATERWAHSLCWKRRSQAGNPTRALEPIVGGPATTRTRGTLERLVRTRS